MKERQSSFSSGELSPTLWGRPELDRYGAGARTVKNWVVTQHGALTNRSGTQKVAQLSGTGPARVVPFVFDESDNVLLVFRHQGVEVWDRNSTDSRHAFTKSTSFAVPYAETDLFGLRFIQVGNVITVTSENYAPLEITRSGTVWTPAYLDFTVPAFCFGVTDAFLNDLVPRVYQGASSWPLAGDGTSHPARPWQWAVTRIIRDSTGKLYETRMYMLTESTSYDRPASVVDGHAESYLRPTIIPLTGSAAVYPDRPMLILLGAHGKYVDSTGATQAAQKATVGAFETRSIEATRIYRGREGRFGFIGETKSNTFTDDGAVPDFSNPPPAETNPFQIYSGGTLLRTEKPLAATIFENRRYFAGTSQRPGFATGSAVGQWSNFDEVIPPDDSDSLSFELASLHNDKIRNLIPWQKLIALTSSAEWLLGGSGMDEVLTPNSVAAHPVSHIGCAARPQAIVSNDTVFMVQTKGVTPYALGYDGRGIRPVDLSTFSRHLFEGFTIVDWSFAPEPYPVLWVVRSDGKLLSCTYLPEQQMLAWAQHEISGSGKVESVATKPEGTEDAVYLVVNRSNVRTVERLAYRLLPLRTITDSAGVVTTIPDVRYGIFLDRSVSYNGLQTTVDNAHAWAISDAGFGAGIGASVLLAFVDDVAEFATPDKSGSVIQVDDPAGGTPYRFLLLNRVANVPNYYNATVLTRDATSYLGVTVSGGSWYLCTSSIGGLSHLEGQTVSALVDGEVIKNFVVTGGSVAFAEGTYAAIAHVGVPYTSDFESLDAVQERNRQKIVKKAWIEAEKVRGGSVGPTLDELTDIKQREVSDAYLLMSAKKEDVPVNIPGRWDTAGRVAYRQSEPLPVTLLGVTREIEYGG